MNTTFLKISLQKIKKISASITMSILMLSTFIPALSPMTTVAHADTMYKVHFIKMIDNNMATAQNASRTSFTINTTYTPAMGTTSQNTTIMDYFVNATNSYRTSFDIVASSSFTASESIDFQNVWLNCSADAKFVRDGYRFGNTEEEAKAATLSTAGASFQNLQSDKYVIIYNSSCNGFGTASTTATSTTATTTNPGTGTASTTATTTIATTTSTTTNPGTGGTGTTTATSTATSTVATTTATSTASTTYRVFIYKYIDGMMATAQSANNSSFGITGTYNSPATNGATTTQRVLGTGSVTNGSSSPYSLGSLPVTSGGPFAIVEKIENNTVSTCPATATTTTNFRLVGYSFGNSLDEARIAAVTSVSPNFTNMTSNKYVIIWNQKCNMGGTGTTTASTTGALQVNSIETVNANATANGSFDNGWKYNFFLTVPSTEPQLSMKFSNWTSGSANIPVANNMRISSMQSNMGSSTMILTGADTYSNPIYINSDLDPNMPGYQVKVLVEMAIPAGSANGNYSTSYGVRTQ